jgi:hypothetical protein
MITCRLEQHRARVTTDVRQTSIQKRQCRLPVAAALPLALASRIRSLLEQEMQAGAAKLRQWPAASGRLAAPQLLEHWKNLCDRGGQVSKQLSTEDLRAAVGQQAPERAGQK